MNRRQFLRVSALGLFAHACKSEAALREEVSEPPGPYYVLSQDQVDCIRRRIEIELNLNPAYVWGAAGLEPGDPGDCSGKLYAILASCGVPVQRVPARMMAAGLGGWRFPRVSFRQGSELSIVIMTTQPHKPSRKYGHVGITTDDVYEVNGIPVTRMAHASSHWGFIEVTIKREPSNFLGMSVDYLRKPNWLKKGQ